MVRLLKVLLALLLAALPSAAVAWPVDRALGLGAGEFELVKVASVEWAEVEDSKIATVEQLPTGELLLTGVTAGQTLLLLYDEGKLAVWRLQVAPKGEPAGGRKGETELSAAKRACPGLKAQLSGERELKANIATELCRKALQELLMTEAFTAGSVELSFEISVLQQQLKKLSQALEPKVAARYSGSTLVLEGKLSPEEHRRALWEVFRHSLGRVHLEDQIELPRSSPKPSPETP